MQQLPKFEEEKSAKIPALALLCHLGWQYYSPECALLAREQKNDTALLREVFREYLLGYRFEYRGQRYPLSLENVTKLIHDMARPALDQGLKQANQIFYHRFVYGMTVTEVIHGKKINLTVPLIDWQQPERNLFVVTEEFKVACTQAANIEFQTLFVLWMAFLGWWLKPKTRQPCVDKFSIDEGMSQSLRNQRQGEIPQLFAYSQVLIALDGLNAQYGLGTSQILGFVAWRSHHPNRASPHQEPRFNRNPVCQLVCKAHCKDRVGIANGAPTKGRWLGKMNCWLASAHPNVCWSWCSIMWFLTVKASWSQGTRSTPQY